MAVTLRKLAASIGLAFSDGTSAQTLVGTDFVLDRNGHDVSLNIDLSSNLQPRNKGLLCYYEAQGLLSQHEQLQSLRISEKDLVKSLSRELKLEVPLHLVLTVGEGKAFSYLTVAEISDRLVTINVREAA
ncbi:MAG: hypothetical protein EPN97_09265 [Alphaproteobacteria bacterium]|nr:MAG: hypothetical protein EPN97_09265 [Alphaproteobacteria bacterium]